MTKIIIVEGIDRVGKSTLCKKLKEKLPCHTFSENRDGIDFSNLKLGDVTKQQLELVDKLDDKIYLFDRFHISEAVYGILKRNYNFLDNLLQFKLIDEKLCKVQSLLILVKPTDLKRSSKEHGSDLTLDELIFEKFYKRSNMKKITCNYFSFEDADLYDYIDNVLRGGEQLDI